MPKERQSYFPESDQEREAVHASGVALAELMVRKFPQTEGSWLNKVFSRERTDRVTYALTGSLAMTLLSQAESISVASINDHTRIADVGEPLSSSEQVAQASLKLARRVKDVDVFLFADKSHQFGGRELGLDINRNHDHLRPALLDRDTNGLIIDLVDTYDIQPQVFKIRVGKKHYYIISPLTVLPSKILHFDPDKELTDQDKVTKDLQGLDQLCQVLITANIGTREQLIELAQVSVTRKLDAYISMARQFFEVKREAMPESTVIKFRQGIDDKLTELKQRMREQGQVFVVEIIDEMENALEKRLNEVISASSQ